MKPIIEYVEGRFAEHPWLVIPVALGVTMLTLSLTRRWHPPWLGRFTDGLQRRAHGLVLRVSRFITRVGLTVVFYTGIALIHAAFVIKGSDPLARRWRPNGTLWTDPSKIYGEGSGRARRQY